MKSKNSRLIDSYTRLVVKRPWVLILAVIAITIFLFVQSQQVETTTTDNQDALPDGVEVIEAFETINSKFGGSDTAKIVAYLEPETENGVTDIRSHEVMEAVMKVERLLYTVEDVQTVNGPASTIQRLNGGQLPETDREAIEMILANENVKSYYDDDYEMVQISLTLDSDYDATQLLDDLEKVTTQVRAPEGVVIRPAGEVLASASIMKKIGGDMGKTSMFSVIGIILVLLLIFRSIRFAAIPLITIGIGVLWTMGFLGILNINLTSTTSGVISMIMGIGIDFGIQIVSRFKQEMRTNPISESMNKTLRAVIKPMTTTTIAAVIGFRAMGLGQITFLAEMGEIMSYGVLGCYLVALLLIPSLLVLYHTVFASKTMKQQMRTTSTN
ncbi:MAG: efflux RND transporter permease subunit [Nanoarchaeota archaeon]